MTLNTSFSFAEGYALRGAAHFADFGHAGAHQHALVGDEHDFVFGIDQRGGHDLAVALALLDGDHAFGTASVAGVFADVGPFLF